MQEIPTAAGGHTFAFLIGVVVFSALRSFFASLIFGSAVLVFDFVCLLLVGIFVFIVRLFLVAL